MLVPILFVNDVRKASEEHDKRSSFMTRAHDYAARPLLGVAAVGMVSWTLAKTHGDFCDLWPERDCEQTKFVMAATTSSGPAVSVTVQGPEGEQYLMHVEPRALRGGVPAEQSDAPRLTLTNVSSGQRTSDGKV